MKRFSEKVALVTGGAFGMGAATAKLFAAEGAKVVICDLLEEEGQKRITEIEEEGGTALFIKLDVTDETQWESAIKTTLQSYGSLNILVNNAGISGSGYQDQGDVKAWEDLMRINATGPFLGTKHAAPAIINSGGGAIVNISSISGVVGQGYIHPGYNASKGAVRTMTKQSAVRFAKDGIRVNSVHPGIMPAMRTSGLTADPVHRQKILDAYVPMKRAGEAIEVAKAVVFLASEDASYITGAELPVDGGYLAI
ncbi:glucose 1-dehydrogenase [Rhodospirillaceae bacterium]|nr:glucose 1-dehydrogenase [Rhodospirillaceae bacterium]MDC0997877.1 glucose 1-dehydrogenase [Alphaproteobacteria bacterium]MDC1442649.1 glucose 1-dehydrogenase [Rhodospirillaceae bacterium]